MKIAILQVGSYNSIDLPEMARKGMLCMRRREYKICITVNGFLVTKVVIDPHYEKKHAESINDEIILSLVNELDGKKFVAEDEKSPFIYFVGEKISLNGKNYKLIWLMEENQNYIGIVNAYRE